MPAGSKTLEVNVPAGIREGAKLRLAGQGDPAPGGTPGDLFLRVRYLPHLFSGWMETTCNATLPWPRGRPPLAHGLKYPTLEGSVEMQIPAGSSSGRKFRLRGKGLGAGEKRGDLLVKIMVRVPAQVTDEERELWSKLAEISAFKART